MIRLLFVITFILMINSCKEEDFQSQPTFSENAAPSGTMDVDYRGQKLSVWKNDQGDYFVNDDVMLYRKEVKELPGSVIAGRYVVPDWEQIEDINIRLWPPGPVNYRLDPAFSLNEKVTISQAVEHWNQKTAVHFSNVQFGEKVYFKKVSSGCSANIGYPGPAGVNTVNVSPTCDLQSIIHEIGHVMGLIHEHQKPGRNDYISLHGDALYYIKEHYPAIFPVLMDNLKIEKSNYGDPFPIDINSVMMYGSYPRNNIALRDDLLSKGYPLYTRKDGSLVQRPVSGLTNKDINLVNYYYYYGKKLILKNIDYNVVRVKIRTEYSDPGIIALNPDEEIVFNYDSQKNKYTYNGHVLQQVGLNNGYDVTNYIKFSWSNSGDIEYFMGQTNPTDYSGAIPLIKNYVNSANAMYYHFTNRDGIDGGSPRAIIEAAKRDDYTSFIYLKRWNSYVDTDGKTHSFDKNSPAYLKIRNMNYPTLNNLYLKFENCQQQNISLSPGQSITLEYTAGSGFSYQGCHLKQVDFNNGNSSDDLNFTSFGEVVYRASESYLTTIIDTYNGYLYGAVDADGIDGKGINAQMDAYAHDHILYIDIKK